jgi:asparagine synthase (glutamine-hydrolysing)
MELPVIGLCGVAFAQGRDEDLRLLDLMSSAFDGGSSRAVESVIWKLPFVSCRLFYRESERLPESDPRLEQTDESQRVLAFVYGKVCPPPEIARMSNDSLRRARMCFEKVYGEGGIDALAGINGHWAAVICDNVAEAVVLSRDPFGSQDFYYAPLGSALCFATHLRALEDVSPCHRVDRTGIGQFLHFLYIPSPRTTLEGVHCVPVGKAVAVDRQGVSVRSLHLRIPDPFWRERPDERTETDMDEPLRRFDDTLVSAVGERTALTGRTAIFLSGGKDSASLCVAAAKVDPRRYLAVTVGFDDASVDESGDAAIVAQHLGIEHAILKFSADEYASALEDYVRVHGQPFANPAGLPTYLALKHLPAEVETVLDGSGNDAYMGLPLDYAERIYLSSPLLRGIARAIPHGALGLLPGRIGRGIRMLRTPIREIFVMWDGWSEQEIRDLFLLDPKLGQTEMSQLCDSPEAQNGDEFKVRAYCRVWVPANDYPKFARPASYLGIPVCFPFSDSRLVSFFSTLPRSLCLGGGVNKVLLREYMTRHLPRRIVEKPKAGFVFRTDRFLRADNYAVLQRYLYDVTSGSPRMACIEPARDAVRRYLGGEVSLSTRLFALTFLSIWSGQHRMESDWL